MKKIQFLLAVTLAAFAFTARAVTNPVVNCATTTVYANVTDPIKLAFAPDGTLFVGRDNSGSGGTAGDTVKIHRVAPGGSPVTEYGAAAIPDPDAVAYDALGIVSGTPGAVLVGGSAVGNGAVISKINTNGAVTQLFGGTQTNMNNPGELLFDASGRLYISDSTSNRVFATSSSAAPTNLISFSSAYELALDVSNRLAVSMFTGTLLLYYTTNGGAAGSGPNIKPGSPVIAGPGDDFWGRELYAVNSGDQLIRIDSLGNTLVVGTNFDGVISLAFGPDHALYVSYRDYDVILRIAPQVSITPNHWWPADGNASNAVNTAHGTLVGGVTYEPGRHGQSFRFDAISSEINFGTNAGNFGSGDFTVMYWMKTTNQATMFALSKWANCGYNNFWVAQLSAGGKSAIQLAEDGGGLHFFSAGGTNSAADGQWHHVSIVRRGTEFRVYQDALLSGTRSTNFITHLFNNTVFKAGTAPCSGVSGVRFAGQLDEIKLYHHALTPAQIADAAGIPGDCAPIAPGMVSWWRGEGNALDSAGTNHGTIFGATFAAGKVGQAFSFDGADGISVPDAVALRPLTNLTIEGWIKTPGISESALTSFIAARSGSGGITGYEFGIGTPSQGGRLRFVLNGGSGGAGLFGTNSVTDDQFHHVAATYDGAAMRVYRDGVCEAELPMTQLISYVAGDALQLGRREYAPIPGFFIGLIDELSIYNRALSLAELQAIYLAGSNGRCAARPTLNIAALPGAVRLTWTTNATGYLLETNSTLTLPAGWGVLTSNYNVLNSNYAVTNAIGGATRFYRLHRP